jgi:hypothetical protein
LSDSRGGELLKEFRLGALQSAATWFLLLLGVCVVAPYAFGVSPRNRRHWIYLIVTIAFLAWLVLGMASLRSRQLLVLSAKDISAQEFVAKLPSRIVGGDQLPEIRQPLVQRRQY